MVPLQRLRFTFSSLKRHIQAVFAINDLASSTRARANLSVLSHNKRAPTPYTPYGMSLHTQISTLTGRVGTHHTTTETHTERDTK